MSIRVIAQTDPFDITSRVIKEYTDCKTIKGVFRKLKIKYKEVPVTVSINGVIVTDWDTKVKDKDLVLIKILPTGEDANRWIGGAAVVGGIVLIATGYGAGIGASLIFSGVTTFFAPELTGLMTDAYNSDSTSGDSVIAPTTTSANYLRGGTNSYGHNKAIPVLLGTHRIYPYQIAHPFTKYKVESSPTVMIGTPGEFDADALNAMDAYNASVRSHTTGSEVYIDEFEALIVLFRAGTSTWDNVARARVLANSFYGSKDQYYVFGLYKERLEIAIPVGGPTQVTSYIANPPTQQLHQVFLWGHEDIDIIEGTFKREDTDVVKAGDPSITTNSLPYYGNETIKQVSIYKSMSAFDPEDTSTVPEIPDGATAHQVILPTQITDIQVSIAIGKFMVVMNSGELETPKTEIEWKLWDITDTVAIEAQTDIAIIQGGETHQAMTQEMTAVNLDIDSLDPDKAYRLDIWRNFDNIKDDTCKFFKSDVNLYYTELTLSHILCHSNYELMTTEADLAYKYSDFMTQDDTIEGAVDNFNAICQTNIMDYNGTGTGVGAWTKRRTNNPASMYLYTLQGKPNKRPVPDAEIDWDTLEKWHIFCDANGFECNAVLTDPGAIENILTMIALTGRATPSNDQLYSVIIDQPQDFPKQLITNVNSFNMRLSRTFNDDVHAIYFSFINKETGYDSDERAVYADGYTVANATNIISQDLPCTTDPTQVFNIGKFMLNCYNRRVETIQVSMDVEYLLAQVGDLVNVSYDQLLLGLARGRVTQVITDGGGLTTDLVLDTDVTMELGTDYAIVVRLTDGTFLKEGTTTTIPIQNTDNTTNTVTLVTPQITSVESMNLVSFGPSESVVGEYTVSSIASGADITATLTLINYDEDVYTLGTMPVWKSNVSLPSDFGSSPILEKVYDVDAVALQAESNSKKLADLYDPGLKTSIKTSTPSATLIRSDCLSVAVSGTTLYFIDKDNLHVYKTGLLAGATRTEIVAEAVKSIAIGYDDRYLLYTAMSNDSMIYKVGLSTGAISQVTTVASQLPKVLDSNFVTYINYEDGQKLYKVNYLETASTGELLLDYNVNSYGIFGTNCIWSEADTQQTYIKKITDNDPTNKGIVYDYGMLYNIIATAPAFWSYPGKDAVAVHIDLGSLKSKTLQDDFFGDVVQHTANKDGRYVMVTSGGDTYTTTFAPEELQNTLDTEVSTEVVDIACSTQYLDNRLYNIGIADIVKIAYGDTITGDGIQEETTVIYVGSNYVTLSQYAITTDASASVSVQGTRLFLNANKVIVPGTVSAGLVESDFYNSQSRVSDTAPVVENRGEPFYKFDALTGTEQQFDEDGNLIRQFTSADGLWLRAGVSVGGIAPNSGVEVPLVPSFTDTFNQVFRQATPPSGAGEVENDTWYDTSTGSTYAYKSTAWVLIAYSPAQLDALGIDAGTINNGLTVATTVPVSAVFTDTVNQVFRQATPPSGQGEIENDAWYETDTGVTYAYKSAVWEVTTYTTAQLDALNIDAGTVNNKTVEASVPSDALFTDTLSHLYTIATGIPNTGGSNPTPVAGGFNKGDVCKVTDSGAAYVYSGTAWVQTSDIAATYFANGGTAGYTGTSSWDFDANGKLTASGASIQGDMEAIALDGLTRTVVDNGSITFYTRVLSTDAWSSIGTLGGGYNGTTPVLIAPQDFMVGDMTVGRGGGNIDTNVALGLDVLSNNTSGFSNVAIGKFALITNTGGHNNTGVGVNSLRSNTTGRFNVGIGPVTLYANIDGDYNVALGSVALFNNTDGSNNIALGHNSLFSNTSGFDNIGIGTDALYSNITGHDIIAIGSNAGSSLTTTNGHTLIGSEAGRYITSGEGNTCIGNRSGINITTGGYNVCLGVDAQTSSATVSQEFILGGASINTLRCNSQTILGLSDRRDKTDIKVSPFGLTYLMDLKPIDFLWKTRDGNAKDGTRALGFIAQELLETEEKFNASHVNSVYTENPDRIEAAYSALLPIMVKAIQEQQELIEKLTSRLNILESK